MGKKDSDARRAQIEREAEEELRRLSPPQGMGGGGFGAPPGAGGPMGGAGMGPISPIEMMAERVRKREVGREAHGHQPRRQGPPARPPVELFSGPVGSGLTPGFGPGKNYQVPPAFAEQMEQGPSGYDTPGFVSPEYEDYDEDEEMTITEMAVMDHAARHGLRPEDSVMEAADPVSAEEIRDQAMQQFINRQGRQRVEGGVVTDPFAPMGMRGRPAPAPEKRGGRPGSLNTRRGSQDRPAVGALARLQERRRQEEEARRREEEEEAAEGGVASEAATVEESDQAYGQADFDDAVAGPEDEIDSGFDDDDDETEPEPAEQFGGGAIGRLLAQRARLSSQEAARAPLSAQGDARAPLSAAPEEEGEGDAWSGGAPGRLHASERMHARGLGQDEDDDEGEEEEDAPSMHLERLMARASDGTAETAPVRAGARARRAPAKPARTTRKSRIAVGQPAKRASLTKAAATTKGAKRVATTKKAGGGTTTVDAAGRSTKAKGGSGRAAEKAGMAKTPGAQRSRAIKATAKKSTSRGAKKTVREMAPAKTINKAPAAKALKAAKGPTKAAKKSAMATKAPARKAGGGGTTTVDAAGRSTKAKGGSGRAAEKAGMAKTPAAKRGRAIKAAAKKSGRASR